MRALVIVDLGFGDCGKGLLTDFLVRETRARMVVRYNGGAQAGHNVVTPSGRHHTFSQFGSGTFVAGVRTFLSRDVIVHPTALLREEEVLRAAGIDDALARLRISEQALVITPFHQALNRLTELARGDTRHGSCGAGVGATVAHELARSADAIRMRDLGDAATLRRNLQRIRDYTIGEIRGIDASLFAHAEAELFDVADDVAEDWIARTRSLRGLIADDDAWVPRGDDDATVVFEGAQGVLLDERHGFHPHTTWSTCTSANARRLVRDFAPRAEVETIGVLRTYAVRHGAGPLPTETAELQSAPAEHNAHNAWQGAVRRGWFDAVLARYAIAADGAIDALAITHLDALRALPRWTYCDAYDDGLAIAPSAQPSLDQQQRLTQRLLAARPILRHRPADEEDVLATIEELAGKPVIIGSRGPTAAHVFSNRSSLEENRGLDRRREVG